MTLLLSVFMSHHCTNQRFPLVRRVNILLNIKKTYILHILSIKTNQNTHTFVFQYTIQQIPLFKGILENQYTLKSHTLALIESNLAIINHNNTSVESKHKRHQLSVSTALNQITEVKLYKLSIFFHVHFFLVLFHGWAIHTTPSTQFFTFVLLLLFNCHATHDS